MVISWIAIGYFWLGFDHHPSLFLLNLAFSTQAAYAAPLILLAQNRQAERDRLRAEEDRLVNQRTQAEAEFLARELAASRLSLGKIEAHRFASPDCFNLAARSFGAMPIAPSASNGYYLLLKPLPKGRHKLAFGAELPSLRQGLEYTLIVE